MFKKLINISIFLFFTMGFSFAQIIEVDSINASRVEKKYSNDEFYFSIEPAYSYRTVINNPKFLTGNAEELSDEQSVWLTSLSLGLRKSLNKNFFLDLGFGFSRNGETYNFESVDSIYTYTNTNRHLAFPLQLAYTTGEKTALYASLGIRPQAFLSVKRDLRYTSSISSFEQEEEIITREGFNLFVIDASLSLGIKVPLAENVGLHVLTIANYQLNNTYDDTSNIIRKAYRIGGAIGLYFKLE